MRNIPVYYAERLLCLIIETTNHKTSQNLYKTTRSLYFPSRSEISSLVMYAFSGEFLYTRCIINLFVFLEDTT